MRPTCNACFPMVVAYTHTLFFFSLVMAHTHTKACFLLIMAYTHTMFVLHWSKLTLMYSLCLVIILLILSLAGCICWVHHRSRWYITVRYSHNTGFYSRDRCFFPTLSCCLIYLYFTHWYVWWETINSNKAFFFKQF